MREVIDQVARDKSPKPLFVPLRTEFFELFENGSKCIEYRLYGDRWNENTCFEGRPITLSHGYGKQRRLHRHIKNFAKRLGSELPPEDQSAVISVYGRLDVSLACIEVTLA
ncbi:MAG: hypothetical protein ACFHHU_00905 [Porticoccaceae bacterium]